MKYIFAERIQSEDRKNMLQVTNYNCTSAVDFRINHQEDGFLFLPEGLKSHIRFASCLPTL